MPSLNVVKYIKESIDSVVNQTLKDLEIICVDAGSNDGTLQILEDYAKNDSRIRIIHSDVKSYGHQMNLGINASTGQYIAIVETDDFVDEKMFETLYSITNNGSVDISKGNFYHLYDDDPENIKVKIDDSKNDLPTNEFTIFTNANILKGHPSIWAAIYNKKFLQENNITFIEAPGGGWVDNPFLFETFILAKSIRYIDEPFYYYRELNPTSSTNNIKDETLPMRRMINVLDLLDKYYCYNENILIELYVRIFHHVHETLEKYNIKDKVKVYNYFSQVLRRMDEYIVINNFELYDQKVYYKYSSPMVLLEKNCFDKKISDEDLKYIIKENNFLYSYYDELKRKNNTLKNKNNNLKITNKKLINQNKKVNQNINIIKQSKAYKIGSAIASPIRKTKKLNHKHPPLNILFIPSNNNTSSCSFISMVSLITQLKTKFNINAFVISPEKGDGDELLDLFNISHKYIESKNWVVPNNEIKYLDEIRTELAFNHTPIKNIRKFIKDNNINLVHINDSHSYVGAEAAIGEKIPFVWHLREILEENYELTLWDRKYGNDLINKSKKVITISDKIYKKYENDIDKNKLICINENIDYDKKISNSDKNIILNLLDSKIVENIFSIYNEIIN